MAGDNDGRDLLSNQARVYRNYLLTCRRLGIQPVSQERAKVLLREWAALRACPQGALTALSCCRASPPL